MPASRRLRPSSEGKPRSRRRGRRHVAGVAWQWRRRATASGEHHHRPTAAEACSEHRCRRSARRSSSTVTDDRRRPATTPATSIIHAPRPPTACRAPGGTACGSAPVSTASGDGVPAPGTRTVPSAATPTSGNRPPTRTVPVRSAASLPSPCHRRSPRCPGAGRRARPRPAAPGPRVSNSFSPMVPAPPTSTKTARSETQPGAVEARPRSRRRRSGCGGPGGRRPGRSSVALLPRRSDDWPARHPSADSRSNKYRCARVCASTGHPDGAHGSGRSSPDPRRRRLTDGVRMTPRNRPR